MLSSIAIGTNAQAADKAPAQEKTAAKTKQVSNPAAYACPKCFMISKGAGKCDHCQVDKVQLGNYYCGKCQKGTGSKPGTCPDCKGPAVQITRKYCAQHSMKKNEMKKEEKKEVEEKGT